MISKLRRESLLAVAVVLAMLAGFPVLAQEESGVTGNSRIVGKITAMDGKTRVSGATVVAYHLSTEAFFYSAVSTGKGEYQFSGLPAGYYDLAVRTPDGLYVGSTVINVAPTRKVIADFSLVAVDAGGSTVERTFPGGEGSATGSARVDRKLTKREFWRSPKGVAILASAGTAALLAIVTSDDTETTVSPF